MPEMIINNLKIEFNDGATVLQAARSVGIDIPALCYHPGLKPYGACRLCLVEVLEGGRPGLAASCTLSAARQLVVQTDTPRVVSARRMVLGLLLARNPNSELLRSFADRYGVMNISYQSETDRCILCGLCVRACEALGKYVLGFSGRGGSRRVCVPFDKPPTDCIGCRACEQVCPVQLIKVMQEQDKVVIWPWQAEITFMRCAKCGTILGSQKQVNELKLFLPGLWNNLCPSCRRRFQASLAAGVAVNNK